MSVQVYNTTGGGPYGLFPKPILSPRTPQTTDTVAPSGQPYQIGQLWQDSVTNVIYIYEGAGSWPILETATGALSQLTGDTGTATPTAGSIKIAGTTNQITTAASGSTVTLSVPIAFIAPGSIASTTTLTGGTGITATTGNIVATAGNITTTAGSISSATTVTAGTGITATTGNIVATAGNISTTAGSITSATTLTATLGTITATNGNLVLGTAGNKILSTSVATTTTAGANSFGSVTLSGGTATVNTSAVTANSLIVIWRQSIGLTGAVALGQLTIGTIMGGSSFVINAVLTATATSLATTDVSVVGWMIIN